MDYRDGTAHLSYYIYTASGTFEVPAIGYSVRY